MNVSGKAYGTLFKRAPCLLGGLLVCGALSGCMRSPSFNVLGSYFPGWILCVLVSVLLTALLRIPLRWARWKRKLPLLPLFYFSLALLIACLLWLILFE